MYDSADKGSRLDIAAVVACLAPGRSSQVAVTLQARAFKIHPFQYPYISVFNFEIVGIVV